uniref:Uncharacterized protein n=1 Tax=Avena sativa TaxID=4498 RepID=A0ACD5UPA9_AVESA
MEGKKKATAAATGSSIVDDLFGPKDGAASAASAGYFSTVFPNPTAAAGKEASRRAAGNKSASAGRQHQQQQGNQSTKHGGSPESPYYGSSSVHYGGRDFYPGAEYQRQYPAGAAAQAPKNKDDGDTSAATRGDWWQGSLYY